MVVLLFYVLVFKIFVLLAPLCAAHSAYDMFHGIIT